MMARLSALWNRSGASERLVDHAESPASIDHLHVPADEAVPGIGPPQVIISNVNFVVYEIRFRCSSMIAQ